MSVLDSADTFVDNRTSHGEGHIVVAMGLLVLVALALGLTVRRQGSGR